MPFASPGAVKFGSILPWERDADIAFSSVHLEKLENQEAKWGRQSFRWVLGKGPLRDVDQSLWTLGNRRA